MEKKHSKTTTNQNLLGKDASLALPEEAMAWPHVTVADEEVAVGEVKVYPVNLLDVIRVTDKHQRRLTRQMDPKDVAVFAKEGIGQEVEAVPARGWGQVRSGEVTLVGDEEL